MTSAEYANYIVAKMTDISPKMSDYSRIDLPTAKLHAKIAVEEIMKHCPKEDAGYFVNVLAEIEAI
jgi:hypothetical protein